MMKIKKPSSNTLALFFSQLAALINAGIPLLQALHILCKKNTTLAAIHPRLHNEIVSGNSLAQGFQKIPSHFDPITCQLIHAGEQSGTLCQMLEKIANYQQQTATLKRKITEACLYPAITLSIAILITLFMLTFITPKFAALFSEMRLPLPAPTRWIITLGNTLQKIILRGLLLIPVFCLWKRKTHWYQRLPLIRSLHKNLTEARFSRTLATLISAGIPLPDALTFTIPITEDPHFQNAILQLRKDISAGRQLNDALRNSPLFPPLMADMVQAGESSGTLDTMLDKLATFQETAAHHKLQLATQLLEPLIMVILGALIGSLVIAMYLPIFRLGNTF